MSNKRNALNKAEAFAQEAKEWYIRDVLERTRGKCVACAAELGMNRTAFYRTLKRYGIGTSMERGRISARTTPPRRMTPEFRAFLGFKNPSALTSLVRTKEEDQL